MDKEIKGTPSRSPEPMFNVPNYCFSSNPLDFEPTDTYVKDFKFEGVSNMSNLFCPKSESEIVIPSVNCKPDADSIKMFVGQIPQHFTESDLMQLFEKYGRVFDLRVLKDKQTGRSKGCCFVTFFARRAALNAQNALHNIRVLPGMHHPVQMKPADSENRNDRKLFVGMLSRQYSESEVRNLFSPYGTIEECTILRDMNGQSKGCAFVTYLTRQSAQNAVKSMHHCHNFEGCSSPLVVKFADTQKDKEMRRLHLLQNELTDYNYTQNLLHHISPESLTPLLASNNFLQQLQNCGYINANSAHFSNLNQVNPSNTQVPNLRSFARPPILQSNENMPCLNHFNGSNFNSTSINSALALSILLAQIHGGLGHFQQPSPGSVYSYPATSFEHMAAHGSPLDRLTVTQKQIEGPEGANLFIYHLPNEFTDQRLGELFNPFGKVISAKVFIDKVTKLSKCFGFVSYDSAISAKKAIEHLNGYQTLGKRLKVEVKKKKLVTRN